MSFLFLAQTNSEEFKIQKMVTEETDDCKRFSILEGSFPKLFIETTDNSNIVQLIFHYSNLLLELYFVVAIGYTAIRTFFKSSNF